jgi:two-component system, OmpR family, response regulator
VKRPHLMLVGGGAASEDLSRYLTDLGYDVGAARACEHILHRSDLDLVIVDWDGAGEGKLDLVATLKDNLGSALVVLTGRDDPVDRVAALETGADDLVIVPVPFQELAARIAGILERRGSGLMREIVRLERVSVDLKASCLLRSGAMPERLGPGEVMLIRALAHRPDQVLTRDELMDLAPAESFDVNDRSIDARVARLRRKLETEAIVTVRGHGYMFVPPHRGGT